jgi:hypothetical protein
MAKATTTTKKKKKETPKKEVLHEGNFYSTPEELANILMDNGIEVDHTMIKRAGVEGNIMTDDGKVGLYELICYLALTVK